MGCPSVEEGNPDQTVSPRAPVRAPRNSEKGQYSGRRKRTPELTELPTLGKDHPPCFPAEVPRA